MDIQKKKTLKEDGRFLIYYHFPNTATPEETAVFESIEPITEERAEAETGDSKGEHKVENGDIGAIKTDIGTDIGTDKEVSHV